MLIKHIKVGFKNHIFSYLCKSIMLTITIVSLHFVAYSQTNNTQIQITDTIIIDTLKNSFADTIKISVNDTLKINNVDTTITKTDSLTQTNIIHKDSVKYSANDYLFGITDSIVVEKWKYNTDIHNFDFFSYDSTIREFHITHPAYRKTINNSYLGNIGLAINSNIFFEPNEHTGFLFLKSFTPYIHQANTTTYYNVRKPFTLFGYQTGPQEEQNIKVIHTQNVSKYFNGFFQFNNYSGKGAYTRQVSQNNSGTFGGAFVKDRFSTHLSFTFAKINVNENGGIVDPFFITDTVIGTAEIRTRLNEGQNYIKDKQLFIDQKIGFLKVRKSDTMAIGSYLFSLQYNYYRQNSFRIYTDKDEVYENVITGNKQTMYLHNYSNSNTFDTSSYTSNNHLLRFNFEEVMGNPLSFGLYFGVGTNKYRYFYYNKDTLFVNKLNTIKNSNFLEGGIFRLNPNSWLNFYAHYRYYISGYKKNNFNINGMLALKIGKGLFRSIVSGQAKTENKTPDYFINNYYSNHYRWNNNFKPQNTTELRAKYYLPNLLTTIGGRYALITNYIYFNMQGVPAQFTSDFNVLDLYIKNTISVHGFNLISKIFFQESSKQEILPLPKMSFYHALYYQRNIHFNNTGGNIKLQLGADVNLWTAFYAQSYSPATAQFHLQNTQKIGNYPFVGVFLNLEIKRMRIYIKGEHVNQSYMTKHNKANYFLAPNYPTTKMTIKYGLTWTFYD